jgi:micrococcal nuclease
MTSRGKVVSISDGDTITVLRGRTSVKIRLHGIDSPESGQDFGTRAKQAASEMAFGKIVTVQPRGTDRYGRTVAEVTLPEGRSLNHEMVRLGMAWWFQAYAPGDRMLERLETEAREAKRGLWSQPSPIPPWDRRQHTRLPAGLATQVVGNRRSLMYHRATCASAARMTGTNRVAFTSEAAAAAAGYRPGMDCFK